VLVVFPELHHCAHHLWHTTTGKDEMHRDLACTPSLQSALTALCREIDRQIEVLFAAVERNATVIVFSLHGMRAARGVPSFLPQLLCEKGFSTLTQWSAQTAAERLRSLLAGVKRRAPDSVKKLYYRTLNGNATKSLARPNMLPVYDWTRTRAFSLPTDQNGWIRINLRQRERDGIVPPAEYSELCDQLTSWLRGLCTDAERPLVRDVFRTARDAAAAQSSKLPDLVVHWAPAAFDHKTGIKDSAVKVEIVSRKFTGQHATDGFCLINRQTNLANGSVNAGDMHSLIKDFLS